MDDARIKQLAEEVRAKLGEAAPASELEARVAALERAVRRLEGAPAPSQTQAAVVVSRTAAHSHASLQLLAVSGGGDSCVLEPDKPCVQSGQCRSLGH